MAGETNQDYVVLARKYRSRTFGELIGQDALVRTLTHAIAAHKIHHAYVLTGIRGVGKTSTARLMAKALNCENGPSVTWDENDPQVKAITAGLHPDVLEFDAASNRGVDEVMQLFSGVAYAPVQGRTKVYIIDEVHMLSTTAFNALLKTLEEPPPNVKFIFATTEVHKIPVTVLSRCQRFDLKRVPVDVLEAHYTRVLDAEGLKAEAEAVRLIARAADGSVRDGLSLLDQAIALSNVAGGGAVQADVVRTMLGLADAGAVMELAVKVLDGQSAEALRAVDAMYAQGQDALMVGQALLDVLHLLTRMKLVPELLKDGSLTEQEEQLLGSVSARVGLAGLNRIYQVLIQGLGEIKEAARPHEALAMVLVRACHVGQLPPLEVLMGQAESVVRADVKTLPDVVPVMQAKESVVQTVALPSTWEEVVKVVGKESRALAAMLAHGVRCHGVREAALELSFDAGGLETPESMVRQLKEALKQATGEVWQVTLVEAVGVVATLREEDVQRGHQRLKDAADDDSVKAALAMFPGAVLEDVIEDERDEA